ncbi:MAG: nuclear transport factor 2 family protein [Pseudomonadota bacterium]|nr:nuclear transport factor 2 family protein [Pseudomonadota bacterium]
MIERTWAEEFAKEWIDAWNSHDLERILSHYADDFEMSSPLIMERNMEPSGVCAGRLRFGSIGLSDLRQLRRSRLN